MYLVESWEKLDIQALEREMILRILIEIFLNFSVNEIFSHSPSSEFQTYDRIGFWQEGQDPYSTALAWTLDDCSHLEHRFQRKVNMLRRVKEVSLLSIFVELLLMYTIL